MGSVSLDSEQDPLFSNLEEEFLAAEDNERENKNDVVDTDLDSLFGDAADDDLHSLFSESEDDDQHPEPPSQHASDHAPEPGSVELTLPQPSASTTTGPQPSQQLQDQDLPTLCPTDLTPDELELLEALTPPFTDGQDDLVAQQEGQCMPSAPDPPASPFSLQDGHTSGGPAVSTQTPSDLPPEPALSLESLDWLGEVTFDDADIEAALAQMERPELLLNGMVDQVSDPPQGEGSQQQPPQQSISQDHPEIPAQDSVPNSSPPLDDSLPQAQEPYAGLPGANALPQANDPNLLTPPASSPDNESPAPADNQYIRVSEIPGFRYGHCYTNRGATITGRIDLYPNQLPILLDYITLDRNSRLSILYRRLELNDWQGKELNKEMKDFVLNSVFQSLVYHKTQGDVRGMKIMLGGAAYYMLTTGWGEKWFGSTECYVSPGNRRQTIWPRDSTIIMVHFMGLLYRIVYQQQVFFRKKEKDAARNNPTALLSPEPSEASVSSPAPVAELEAFSPEATTASPETGSEGSETCSEGVMMTATTTSSTSLQAVMESVETGAPGSLEIYGNTTTTPVIENPSSTVTENALPMEIETTSEPKVTKTPVSVPIPGSCTASVGVVTPVLESTTVAPVETKVPTIATKTTQIAAPVPIASTATTTVTPVQTTVPGNTTTATQTVTSAPTPVCINTSVPSITTTSTTQTDTPVPTINNSTPTATSTATPKTNEDLIFTGTRKRTHDEFAKGCEKEVAQQATTGPVPVATFVLDVPDDADLTYHVHMKNRSTNEDVSPPVTYQHSLSPIVRSGFYTYIMNTIGTICGRTSVSPYIHVLSAGCPRNVRSDADWDSVVMDVYNQKLVGKEGPVLVMCYV
ncbi:hypothetical protein GE21DRAFT_4647 [Neurospora crassa]|uniref:Uncharacterized protein n=1 Tax=Neurospora crassa (strain ATCC 24698 / 74-OR23-1A / CBS 708.71 / DSM 1257 / FGSC 987) TaxID=367110 RepID=Q7RZN3_NEUCR|nr:hypothetical protein NCU00331 [Neurospora crassa OR74A]EAA28566.1 hypothetical protein NCU00331 [Neurospora crassa OR74A]KHE89562.1 hypothetical protein GE21DRAFT_4647 [Neurospora crassa]|eukprot:XP_957802.1 hypothetical protein NCU00331 [Neurospora crassa OR74A]